MSWTIGKSRVEEKYRGGLFSIVIDDEPPKPIADARLLGEFPIRIGKIEAKLRRVRNLDVARSELWIGDHRIPHSENTLAQLRAAKGSLCEGHAAGTPRTAYRSSDRDVPAKYECPLCSRLFCRECIAADRVRCVACFEAAARDDERTIASLRRKGPLIGVGIGAVIASLGAAFESTRVVGLGAATVAFVLVRVGFGYRSEKLEQKKAKAAGRVR